MGNGAIKAINDAALGEVYRTTEYAPTGIIRISKKAAIKAVEANPALPITIEEGGLRVIIGYPTAAFLSCSRV